MRIAFTLIELLVVITIILLLMGMLASGGMMILQRAHRASSEQTVHAVVQAVLLYRDEDERRRFPPEQPDYTLRHRAEGAYAGGTTNVATLLMKQGLAIHGERLSSDGSGEYLADAWGEPIRYQVDAVVDGTPNRPLDAISQPVRVPEDVADWNPRGAQPFAYVWSYGRPSSQFDHRDHAKSWLYHREAP